MYLIRISVTVCSLALITLLPACAPTTRGGSIESLERAQNQNAKGAQLFRQNCASCHGQRGEGASAPAILGIGALPEYPRARDVSHSQIVSDQELMQAQALTRPPGASWRDPFRTANDLFTFVSKHMPLPKEKIGSLASDEYWDVVTFMLIVQGVPIPADGVAPHATSIRLH